MSEDQNRNLQEPETEGMTGKKKKGKKKRTVGQEILSWIFTIVSALVIVVVIRSFIFEPIRVKGGSMTNTLQDGEILFCSKLNYLFEDIERDDIVICNYPGRTDLLLGFIPENTRFVKRVVALPGDTVAVRDGEVYVNGTLVPAPEMAATRPMENYPPLGRAGEVYDVKMEYNTHYDQELCNFTICTDPECTNELDFPAVHLGEDQYLVVGDNRGPSHDSRAVDVGPISRKAILGKVLWVLFPFNAIRTAK